MKTFSFEHPRSVPQTLLSCLLSVTLVLHLGGCDGDSDDENNNSIVDIIDEVDVYEETSTDIGSDTSSQTDSFQDSDYVESDGTELDSLDVFVSVS